MKAIYKNHLNKAFNINILSQFKVVSLKESGDPIEAVNETPAFYQLFTAQGDVVGYFFTLDAVYRTIDDLRNFGPESC